MKSDFYSNYNLLSLSIEDLGLSHRVVRLLKEHKIPDLNALLHFDLTQIKTLGIMSREEISKLLELVSFYLNDQPIGKYLLFSVDENQLIFNYIFDLTNAILFTQSKPNLIKIIKLKFGLKGTQIQNLTEIGQTLKVSKERIRQQILYSIDIVSRAIIGKALYYTLRLPKKILNDSLEFQSFLITNEDIYRFEDLIILLEKHYQITFDKSLENELIYLLSLFNFQIKK